jgi:hypothetical protein
MNRDNEPLFSDVDQQLLKSYREHSQEQPSSDVDRLILAAAHRNDRKSQKNYAPEQSKASWLSKMRLPVAVTGACIMTLAVAHIIWPVVFISEQRLEEAAAYSVEQEQNQALTISLQAERIVGETDRKSANLRENAEKNAKLERQTASENFYPMPEASLTDSVSESTDIAERERWVKRIVKLAQQGNYQSMNQELKAFVAAYPDFPIDTFIRPYIQ